MTPAEPFDQLILIGRYSPPLIACANSYRSKNWPTSFIDTLLCSGPIGHQIFAPVDFIERKAGCTWLESLALEISRLLAADANCKIGVVVVSYEVGDQVRGVCAGRVACLFMSSQLTSFAQSKTKQASIAIQCDMDLLETWAIDTDVPTILDKNFPVVIRPDDEAEPLGFKFKVLNNLQELNSLNLNGRGIIQRLVTGKKLVIHAARRMNGESLAQSFTVESSFEGLTLSLAKDQASCGKLTQKCSALLDLIDYVGVCHFEFVCEGQNYFLLDINLRLGGTTNKVLGLGYDEPALLIWCFSDYDSDQLNRAAPTYRRVTNKQVVLSAIYARFVNQWSAVDYPNESLITTIRYLGGLMLTAVDENYQLRYLRSSIFNFLNLLRRVLFRIT